MLQYRVKVEVEITVKSNAKQPSEYWEMEKREGSSIRAMQLHLTEAWHKKILK